MSGMYGNGIGLTEKVLDYLWGRQNITLNNIANVDTPGFKAQYVTFEEELAKKIQNAGGADGGRPGAQLRKPSGQAEQDCAQPGMKLPVWMAIM